MRRLNSKPPQFEPLPLERLRSPVRASEKMLGDSEAGEIGVVELLDAYEAARDTNLSVIALALNAAESAVEYDVTTGRNYE
jgi:hypothetical protein